MLSLTVDNLVEVCSREVPLTLDASTFAENVASMPSLSNARLFSVDRRREKTRPWHEYLVLCVVGASRDPDIWIRYEHYGDRPWTMNSISIGPIYHSARISFSNEKVRIKGDECIAYLECGPDFRLRHTLQLLNDVNNEFTNARTAEAGSWLYCTICMDLYQKKFSGTWIVKPKPPDESVREIVPRTFEEMVIVAMRLRSRFLGGGFDEDGVRSFLWLAIDISTSGTSSAARSTASSPVPPPFPSYNPRSTILVRDTTQNLSSSASSSPPVHFQYSRPSSDISSPSSATFHPVHPVYLTDRLERLRVHQNPHLPELNRLSSAEVEARMRTGAKEPPPLHVSMLHPPSRGRGVDPPRGLNSPRGGPRSFRRPAAPTSPLPPIPSAPQRSPPPPTDPRLQRRATGINVVEGFSDMVPIIRPTPTTFSTQNAFTSRPQGPISDLSTSNYFESYYRSSSSSGSSVASTSSSYEAHSSTDDHHHHRHSAPRIYRVQCIRSFHPPPQAIHLGVPFLTLEIDDVLDVVSEGEDPSIHNLPVYGGRGGDRLLVCRDAQGRVGWCLSSFVVPFKPAQS